MAEVPLNLTGRWQGQYFYPVQRAPVPFAADLSEIDGWLSGVVEEIGRAGDARGLALSASIQGRRSGHGVTWLKLYDGAFRLYDAVRYEGEVNADATEIAGRWSIPGNWSGTFLMVRPRGTAVPARLRAEIQA